MRRVASTPRHEWQARVESQGLIYHTPNGTPYWDESACYVLRMDEVLQLEAATTELQRLCLEAAQHVIDRNRFSEFGLSERTAAAIRRAWDQEPPAIYGRFDLAYDGTSPPKLLEYNADTPTSLLEAAVIQWYWLQDTARTCDQWNSIHERLVAKWTELRAYLHGPVCFAHVDMPEHEDLMTVAYLRETAIEAGLTTSAITIDAIGLDQETDRFVDRDGRELQSVFKLYPWEWLVDEAFGDALFRSLDRGMQWIEPIWKMLWSNKAILPVLWELFPNHPNLLPAYFDGPRHLSEYVHKPKLSREGANITLVSRGKRLAQSGGDYGADGYVFQGLAPMAAWDGLYPVLGAWVIDGEAAGMGIRESDGPITGNLARFVPHRIEG